jgi:hypothetical protein
LPLLQKNSQIIYLQTLTRLFHPHSGETYARRADFVGVGRDEVAFAAGKTDISDSKFSLGGEVSGLTTRRPPKLSGVIDGSLSRSNLRSRS